MMNTQVLFIHVWTPLHAGTGQAIGAVDLPIAREKATGIPYLPGSSLKGVLRDRMESLDNAACQAIYGPDTEHAAEHAGSLHFGDARLVCMPVRSLAGTFGYATSPYLLERLARDLEEAGIAVKLPPSPSSLNTALVTPNSRLLMKTELIFEDLNFRATKHEVLDQLANRLAPCIFADEAGQQSFKDRLTLLHDDVMSYLLEQATEVRARIRINDASKTVAKGALWYEEALPAESILASLLVAMPPPAVAMNPQEIFEKFAGETTTLVQLGGNGTIGRGQCRLSLAGGAR